jgi:LacI family transcriptional regulator
VPAELSIVGFDDIRGAAASRPSLTTVRQPLHLKGYAAARLLLDPQPRFADPAEPALVGDQPGEFDLPIELVVRRSTAVARPA